MKGFYVYAVGCNSLIIVLLKLNIYMQIHMEINQLAASLVYSALTLKTRSYLRGRQLASGPRLTQSWINVISLDTIIRQSRYIMVNELQFISL